MNLNLETMTEEEVFMLMESPAYFQTNSPVNAAVTAWFQKHYADRNVTGNEVYDQSGNHLGHISDPIQTIGDLPDD